MSTTLYRYFNSEGQLLYVGITKNQFQRQDQHAKTQDWWHEVASATFTHLQSRAEALHKETFAIANELPKYNKAGPTIKQELLQHLLDIAGQKLTDNWHTNLSLEISEHMADINEFSQQSEAYKLAWSLDTSIEWDERGEKRETDCLDCDKLLLSSWFKFASDEANNLIADEYYA